jgi:hypothetical protein
LAVGMITENMATTRQAPPDLVQTVARASTSRPPSAARTSMRSVLNNALSPSGTISGLAAQSIDTAKDDWSCSSSSLCCQHGRWNARGVAGHRRSSFSVSPDNMAVYCSSSSAAVVLETILRHFDPHCSADLNSELTLRSDLKRTSLRNLSLTESFALRASSRKTPTPSSIRAATAGCGISMKTSTPSSRSNPS